MIQHRKQPNLKQFVILASMFRFSVFEFNPFQENTYVLFDETREAVIVDPGCSNAQEQGKLSDFIDEHGLVVKYVLNTHCHIDHVLGNHFAISKYKAPLLIPHGELELLQAVKAYAPNYGFPQCTEAKPDRFIKDEDIVPFGKTTLHVLSLPGHSPGHVGFYLPGEKMIFSGDVLFQASIGRTDLPGGDYQTLIRSIHARLFVLPDDVTVYPGHGPETTIGEEKVSNPFCALPLGTSR